MRRLLFPINMARSSCHFCWHFAYEVRFSSVIRGHHVYKTEWSPKVGEILICQNEEREETKEHDEYAVGTFLQENHKLAGHVSLELSFLVFTFVQAHKENQVRVAVTGTRTLENGLVVPGCFSSTRTTSRQMGITFELI